MIRRVPGVALFQRFLLRRVLEGREFVHTIDAGPAKGLRFPISLPQDKNVWTGTYETHFSSLLANAVKRGDVCFDVGSWRAFFSGVFALAGASKVYAFEPLPSNVAHIRKVLELNPELPITLFEVAVADRCGETSFSVLPASSMGKLPTSSFQAAVHGTSEMVVKIVSLDGLIASGEAKLPDVVKIDVEGAEVLVLHGAHKLIREAQPTLFIEVHSLALGRECRAFLESLGYTIKGIESSDRAGTTEVSHIVAVPKRSCGSTA